MEKIDKEQQLEGIKGILENEDFGRMWMKMHTPWVRRTKKVGRNEPCPCGSGKKFKNCECYAKRFTAMYTLDEKHTKGWR
jgi:uncharacterized protein YecA (UPF0149 family)